MGSNKEWIIHNEFKGLSAAIIKKINRDVDKGLDPFLGEIDEEDMRFKIDDIFDTCIKDNINYDYTEGLIDFIKHKYLNNLFDELDIIIDKWERKISSVI